MSKCHIVGNHLSLLNYVVGTCFSCPIILAERVVLLIDKGLLSIYCSGIGNTKKCMIPIHVFYFLFQCQILHMQHPKKAKTFHLVLQGTAIVPNPVPRLV